MSYDLKNKLVIAVTTRALFDLEKENEIFMEEGKEKYTEYQIEHEDDVLNKGTAFPMIEMLLSLNEKSDEPVVEVIVMSRNSPETGLRVFNSIEEYGLGISRAAFTGGEDLVKYMKPFEVDLFLSKNDKDVQDAINSGFAAARLYDYPKDYQPDKNQIKMAFDADAVVFSDESEYIYKTEGLPVFIENEREKAEEALSEGPFGKLIRAFSKIKEEHPDSVRIAIFTARNSPAHKRVILTLRKWGVTIDEAFFLGGINKEMLLKAYNAHIFFDDQDSYVKAASEQVPAGRVPYNSSSKLNDIK